MTNEEKRIVSGQLFGFAAFLTEQDRFEVGRGLHSEKMWCHLDEYLKREGLEKVVPNEGSVK